MSLKLKIKMKFFYVCNFYYICHLYLLLQNYVIYKLYVFYVFINMHKKYNKVFSPLEYDNLNKTFKYVTVSLIIVVLALSCGIIKVYKSLKDYKRKSKNPSGKLFGFTLKKT